MQLPEQFDNMSPGPGRKPKNKQKAVSISKENPLCYGKLRLFVGARIEAFDSKKWYHARIVKINESNHRVLVHFDGWNSRHDKWFDHKSDLLRPLSSGEQKQHDAEHRKDLRPGDRVLARWSDSKFYPAKVCAAINSTTLEVVFFDGFKKRLNKSSIRPDPKRTFETFEEKFKESPQNALPQPSTSNTPTDDPSTPGASRSKRRHAEPSTMADFVTSMPGKRYKKHQFGNPSDSDEQYGLHDIWDNSESQTTQTSIQPLKVRFGFGKKRRRGSPIDSASSTSPTSSISSLKVSPPEQKSENDTEKSPDDLSLAEYKSSLVGQGSSGTGRRPSVKGVKHPPLKPLKKKKLVGSFLRIKLKSPSKNSGVERKGHREKGNQHTFLDVADSGAQRAEDTHCAFESGTSKETYGTELVSAASEPSEPYGLDLPSYSSKQDAGCLVGLSGNQSYQGAVATSPRKEHHFATEFNVKKKLDSTKSNRKSLGELKRPPRRERKLTEKGLELVQKISHKKGVEGLLQESFFSPDVGVDHKEPEEHARYYDEASASCDVFRLKGQHEDLGEQPEIDVDVADQEPVNEGVPAEDVRGSKDFGSQRSNIKLVPERNLEDFKSKGSADWFEESKSVAGSSHSDIKQQQDEYEGKADHSFSSATGDGNNSDSFGKKIETRKSAEDTDDCKSITPLVKSDEVTTKIGITKCEEKTDDVRRDEFEDENYSDTYSDGSDGLVIDIEDENDAAPLKVAGLDEDQESVARPMKIRPEKKTMLKPRIFPRLKYTLSHEERRGNRLARMKQIRAKLKSKKLKEGKAETKPTEEAASTPAIATPLQSLTKMVTDTAEPTVVIPTADSPVPVDDPPLSASGQKAENKQSKPKQQRAYKSRSKNSDTFLSMVEQDRPSQVDRPLFQDLVKEKSSRGKQKNRNTNKLEESTFIRRSHSPDVLDEPEEIETVLPSDLNEPLDFASSGIEAVTRLEQADGNQFKSMTRPVGSSPQPPTIMQNIQPAPPRSGYGVPCYITYPGPQSTFIGPMTRHISPNPQPPYQCRSPHLHSPIPDAGIKSESPSMEMMKSVNIPLQIQIEGVRTMSEMPVSMPPYGLPLQHSIDLNLPAQSRVSVPLGHSHGVTRYPGPGGPPHSSAPFSSKNVNCPCDECRKFSSRAVGMAHARREESDLKISPRSHGQTIVLGSSSERNSGSVPLPKISSGGDGIVITDVFSLRDVEPNKAFSLEKTPKEKFASTDRDPSGKQDRPVGEGSATSLEASTVGTSSKSQGTENEMSEVMIESESSQTTPRPREFENKKKRLDLITGKLSAQRKTVQSPFEAKEREQEISNPESIVGGGPKQEIESAVTRASPITLKPETSNTWPPKTELHPLPNRSLPDHMIPQVNFAPIMNANFEQHYIGVQSSMEGPIPRAISPEGHLISTYQPRVIQGDPNVYYHHAEQQFVQLRPVFERDRMPHPGLQPLPHGLAYLPPEMAGYPRIQPMPQFQYQAPRYVPMPGYYHPREPPLSVPNRPPPPYSTVGMQAGNQRFVPIAPNGQVPLVVCKKPNCNCHLPHAAPPLQIAPKHSQDAQTEEPFAGESTETQPAKESQPPTVPQAAPASQSKSQKKKSETLQKGDPRRLTLPLQRLKKIDVKPNPHKSTGSKSEGKKKLPIDKDAKKSAASALESSGMARESVPEQGNSFEVEGKENSPVNSDRESVGGSGQKDETDQLGKDKHDTSKAQEKLPRRESGQEKVLAPKEFIVELDLDEFKCGFKGCKKAFRKASSRDYHQRYFHSPRVPHRKRKPSSCLPSPLSSHGDTLPFPGGFRPSPLKRQRNTSGTDSIDARASTDDLSNLRSGYASSVMTDEGVSDREKHEDGSSDDSDESDMESEGSVCVDDIIRCKCGDLEEQGFMIQCEQCFTWQHGDCVSLSIETVPKNYLCYVCTNPEGLRSGCKYKNNFEWYKRGTLPSLIDVDNESQEKIAQLMQASHALMEDIANVFDVIEGIKKKLVLLKTPFHPVLRFWKRKLVDKAEEKSDDAKETSKIVEDTSLQQNGENQGASEKSKNSESIREGTLDDGGNTCINSQTQPHHSKPESQTVLPDSENNSLQIADKNWSTAGNVDPSQKDVTSCQKDGPTTAIDSIVSEKDKMTSEKGESLSQKPGPLVQIDRSAFQKHGTPSVKEGLSSQNDGLMSQKDVPPIKKDEPISQKYGTASQINAHESNRGSFPKDTDSMLRHGDESRKENLENYSKHKAAFTQSLSQVISQIRMPPQVRPKTAESSNSNTNTLIEGETVEVFYAKMNLLDHLDKIEEELNQRMDNVEQNLDVLEEKYNQIGEETKDGDSRSAFKVALPDMTSIARHLNMINRQLLDLS